MHNKGIMGSLVPKVNVNSIANPNAFVSTKKWISNIQNIPELDRMVPCLSAHFYLPWFWNNPPISTLLLCRSTPTVQWPAVSSQPTAHHRHFKSVNYCNLSPAAAECWRWRRAGVPGPGNSKKTFLLWACWVELQTNLRKDYAKFYNNGEVPY